MTNSATRCSTEGVLVESIFGATSMTETSAMRRGLMLEEKVLKIVGKKYNTMFKKSGLILCKEYPVLGASPDGISEKYVVEIKCPVKKDIKKLYKAKWENKS
ncbi:hypothetical protein NQ314_003639 [Rhamnusium bicolor]|uniref:YqaJ viral recombinase domain-containing protein n=1 Tax=Rhamnusium bicolor TaxID=1586634 RepID=A0AAV8ZN67_9CUCU|nr:hypothetical protein NQ314_003639 [Rhamnusium bicolor]